MSLLRSDASDGAGAADAAPDVPATPNLVFVTSTTVDLCAIGVSGADAECAARAIAAGLPGTYVSWTSQAGNDARDRIGAARGWVRPDGLPFADTLADLVAGNVIFPPRLDENGIDLGPFTVSGTRNDGTYDPTNGCMLGGRASRGASDWFSVYLVSSGSLVCLGVDRQVPVTFTPQTGRIAFASTATFVASTGIATADTICSSEASAVGLPGTYRAFLSTTTVLASARFDLGGPRWVRTDGIPIVQAAADLASMGLLAPLDRDRSGTRVSAGSWVGGTGAPLSSTCNDWTTSSMTVLGLVYFLSETGSNGYTSLPSGCSFVGRVRCFQE